MLQPNYGALSQEPLHRHFEVWEVPNAKQFAGSDQTASRRDYSIPSDSVASLRWSFGRLSALLGNWSRVALLLRRRLCLIDPGRRRVWF
jgi:hypothetical protein